MPNGDNAAETLQADIVVQQSVHNKQWEALGRHEKAKGRGARPPRVSTTLPARSSYDLRVFAYISQPYAPTRNIAPPSTKPKRTGPKHECERHPSFSLAAQNTVQHAS